MHANVANACKCKHHPTPDFKTLNFHIFNSGFFFFFGVFAYFEFEFLNFPN